MKIKNFFFAAFVLLLASCVRQNECSQKCDCAVVNESKELSFDSSDKNLELTFYWAAKMALSYAHDGDDPVGYWYEAALPNRNAFCMRDAAHQSIGAEILGLSKHNYNMMSKFVSNISESKDWCTYWEIDKDDKPCPADYVSDNDFWYNLNANFDVMYACWRLYEWTGDKRYLEDSAFNNFYSLSTKEYVDSWQLNPSQILTRTRDVNKKDDAKSFRSSRGVPSYVETFGGLYSSSDLVATIYGGFNSYSKILAACGNETKSKEMALRAEEYRKHLEEKWWSADINTYHTFWTSNGTFADGEGLTHVLWFNAVQNPERIRGTVEKMLARKEWNIENVSYFPLLWYRYSYKDEAYKILKDVVIADRCEYPEVSFGMLEGIVSGAMGIQPSASKKRVVTLPQISGEHYMQINNLPMLGGTITVRHDNNQISSFVNNTPNEVVWEAAFIGEYDSILVNGKKVKANKRKDAMNGAISYCEVRLTQGETALCKAIKQ